LLKRFGENAELLSDVRQGMNDNLRLAKQNIEYLKKGGTTDKPVETSVEKVVPESGGGPPSSNPPTMPKRA